MDRWSELDARSLEDVEEIIRRYEMLVQKLEDRVRELKQSQSWYPSRIRELEEALQNQAIGRYHKPVNGKGIVKYRRRDRLDNGYLPKDEE